MKKLSSIVLFLGVAACFSWASIAIDVTTSINKSASSRSVKSNTFSTSGNNELLLALISADATSSGNMVTGVSGAGLTWVLVVRANSQMGTAEIWRAFAATPVTSTNVTATLTQSVPASLTVIAFAGVNTSGTNGSGAIGAINATGANPGAPSASLTTSQNGSWVFGVGNDWDNSIARTLGPSQTLINQAFTTSDGYTFWSQSQATATPLSGTTVAINDTAPATDRYNLAIAEILPAQGGITTFSISGTISPTALGSGSTVILTENGTTVATTTADTSGNYSFPNLQNGSYTVTPGKTALNFNPSSQSVTVAGASNSGVNFTAAAQTWSISGNISPAVSGIPVALTGSSTANTTTDSSGNYSFNAVADGSYTVTPNQSSKIFSPVSESATVNGANVAGENFTWTAAPTWTISGTVTPALSGVNVSLTGSGSVNTTTDVNGAYTFPGLFNGSYTVTPALTGYSFTPNSQALSISGANGIANFTDQATTSAPLGLDVQVSTDVQTASKTVASPAFSTKAGNELLLALISADYLSGANTTVTGITGGGLSWVLVQRANGQPGTSEIWRAFTPSILSNATVTATLSQTVESSMTVLSFTGVNPSGTNGSGAIGATVSASAKSGAPTASLVTTAAGSWVFGVGDDYTNAVVRTLGANQTLIHEDLSSSGDTYWVQSQNALTPIAKTSVNINDAAPTADEFNLAAVEVLSAGGVDTTPPTVAIISPVPAATVATLQTLTAQASDNVGVASVQFQLDGANLGAPITAAPYELVWDSSSTSPGTHTLTAIARDGTGNTATASPISFTVDHSGNPAIVGSWAGKVSLPAVAVNLILLNNNKLLFYQDGSTPEVWDYVNNVLTNVPTSADLFCSGHADLADGRVLVVGGYGGGGSALGIRSAEIFDPSSNTWTKVPNMNFARWYPTATTLPDGRIVVDAGWQTTEHSNVGIPEIYDPTANTWTELSNANNPFETYPFMYLLPDGRVAHVGGSESATITETLNVNAQTWTTVDANIVDGSSSKMYLPYEIMKAGAAADSQMTGPATNTTFVIDMSQASPAWQQTPSMAYPRSFMNLTELPDGSVLATGGETDKNGGNIANAVYAAELWNPQTQTWMTLSSMMTPREYHGTALLLPDGRVVESGMGADFGNVPDQLSAEFFSPPYLFKGPRPTITQAPTQMQYGQNYAVATPDGASISRVVLIRTGSVTHFHDQNTRYVPVSFSQVSGGLSVTAPADGNAAPPGYYMLFLVNSAGVPSIATFVQITQ